MRGENMVAADERVRRRVRHLVEVSVGQYVNYRGEAFPSWSMHSMHDHPEFANQAADGQRAHGMRVRVRPVIV